MVGKRSSSTNSVKASAFSCGVIGVEDAVAAAVVVLAMVVLASCACVLCAVVG